MMTLYSDSNYYSPYVTSVFVTLEEKGLPYSLKKVDLSNKDDDFLQQATTLRVPLLIHGELLLTESSAITEYLEDAYPAPDYAAVYPNDVKQRAIARQVQAWLRSDLLPIREERPTALMFTGDAGDPLSAECQQSVQQLFKVAQTLLKPGAKNLFDEWCLADTDLALMINRLTAHDDVPQRLRDYVEHQWSRPTVQKWVDMANQ